MIVVESHLYPFMLISFRGAHFTEAEYEAMLAATVVVGRKARLEGTRHVSITTGGVDLSASDRRMVARHMETFPTELLELVVGSYVVVTNPATRGILTALRWLSPALGMIEPVASGDAAVAASTSAFRKHGITVGEDRVREARRWLTAEASRSSSPLPS